MSKRLLVTGGSGFVAGSVIAQGREACEIHALSRGEAPVHREGLLWHQLDLLDTKALRRVFAQVRPDAVIHTAAIADIDYSEAHHDVARKVNVQVTRSLADLCAPAGIRLVFTSTDTVFDGQRGNYSEEDVPVPVNFYGRTKVEAEQVVAATGSKGVIARLALVVGLPVLGAGNSFLAKMISLLSQGKPYGVPAEEVRTPIDVITLGQALLELAGAEHLQGIFHLAGNDVLNRLEMVQRIAKRLGYPEDLTFASDVSKVPNRAPRPRDVSLNNAKARSMLKTPMKGLDAALDLIIRTSGLRKNG
jgi:dTDP-4-dehydrorhamnose reductase